MNIYDPDIRKVLYKNFIRREEFTKDSTTKVIDEMQVCRGFSRVDIAVINGKIHGFEIKSERDTLDRLEFQMESYNKIFDTMTIVTCKNHLEKVKDKVPSWWGIYYVDNVKGDLVLKKKRKEKVNKKTDLFSLSQLLWKEELLSLLNNNGISKGIKSKTRSALCEIAISNIDEITIRNYIRACLKSRQEWRAVSLQQLYDGLQ